MRLVNYFRPVFGVLLLTIAGLFATGASTEVKAQCPVINLLPVPGMPCCYRVQVTTSAAGVLNAVQIATVPGNLVGAIPFPISVVAAAAPGAMVRFGSSGPNYPASSTFVIGRVCFTGVGVAVITTNIPGCPVINFPYNCNGPAGGGGGGNPGINLDIPDVNIDLGFGKKSVDSEVEVLSSTGFSLTPNPASAISSLRFSTPETMQNVTVSLFDVTGREVMKVLDGATIAAGAQELSISTETLNVGMYQISVRAQGTQLFSTTLSVVR